MPRTLAQQIADELLTYHTGTGGQEAIRLVWEFKPGRFRSAPGMSRQSITELIEKFLLPRPEKGA